MNYKVYIYVLSLFISAFAISSINWEKFFIKNKFVEAKIFVMLVAMALGYLVGSFIIEFLGISRII